MDAWKPTSPENKITARKLAGDHWTDVEVKDLLPGDIVKMVSPRGDLIDPYTNEEDEDCVSLVAGHPIKNDLNQIGSLLGNVGYGVPLDRFDTMAELRRRGLF